VFWNFTLSARASAAWFSAALARSMAAAFAAFSASSWLLRDASASSTLTSGLVSGAGGLVHRDYFKFFLVGF
jgi:hypothetical protein